MIYDKLNNLKNYPMLSRVKNFFISHKGEELADGKYIIDKNCYLVVSEYETGQGNDFEAHKEYIDVQILVRGREYVFVQDIQKGKEITEYDSEKDIIFYTTDNSVAFLLDESTFILFDSHDLHKPCVAVTKSMKVKKYVFKIKAGECRC